MKTLTKYNSTLIAILLCITAAANTNLTKDETASYSTACNGTLSFCYGARVSDLVGIISGTISGTIKVYLKTGSALTTTVLLTTNTTYYYTVNGSPERTPIEVIVNQKSVAGSISGAGAICSGSSKTLTLSSSHVGTVQWQSYTEGSPGFLDMEGKTSVELLNPALTETTQFRAVVTNGVCPSATTPIVTVTVSPTTVAGTIVGGDVTVCAYSPTESISNSTDLILKGYTDKGAILWQKSTNYAPDPAISTWSSAGSTTDTFTAKYLTVDTWYRAIVTSGACKATSAVVKISVNKVAKAGTFVATVNDVVTSTVCAGGDITFTSAPYVGTSIQWEVSTNATDFTEVLGETGPVFIMNVNTKEYPPSSKFYVRNVVKSGKCTTAYSAAKTITVKPVSVAGKVTGGAIICPNGGGTVTVTGYVGSIQWMYSTNGNDYENAPQGSASIPANGPTFTSTSTGTASTYIVSSISANTYFKAKIKSGACSEVETNVVQYVLLTAIAGSISPLDGPICPAGTTLNLEKSEGTITWQKSTNWLTATPPTWISISDSDKTSLTTGTLTVSTAYRVEVKKGSCPKVTSDIEVVSLVAKPVARAISRSVTSPNGTTDATALCTTNHSKILSIISPDYKGSIQWQRASATSEFYDIKNDAGENETGTSCTVTNSTAGVNYFRVKFSNSCDVSVYSPVVTVYYKDCPEAAVAKMVNQGAEIVVIPFKVIAYPNPSNHQFTLSMEGVSNEKTEVMVYDVLGRLVNRIEKADGQPIVFGKELAIGQYFAIVKQGTNQLTVRLIKRE